jgi:hypothetical protein
MSILQKKRDISAIDWERYWPNLSPLYLSFLELERDPYYEFLPTNEIEDYLQKAIEIGTQTAKTYRHLDTLSFFNRVIKNDLRIRLLERHPEQPDIRAQYAKKKQTIIIYKNSIDEIQHFFQQEGYEISPLAIMAMHVYHEWFHHLEHTSIGRTDLKFPSVVMKQRGPFLVKRRLSQLREIAAHSFTQAAMGLDWSPLLLDQFRYLFAKGYTHSQIRERFQDTKNKYYAIIKKISH